MVIDPITCIVWALFLLILPPNWLIAAFVAAVLHELCHYSLLRCFGIKPGLLHVGIMGMKLNIPQLSAGKELVCAIAGPLGGGLLILLSRWFPRLSLCALVQSAFNLLPVYPLDGGRIFRCIMVLLLPDHWVHKVCIAVEIAVLSGIAVLSLYYKWPFLLFLPAVAMIHSDLLGKTPCKPSRLRVQ